MKERYATINEVGNKAYNLMKLMSNHVDVPEFYVLTHGFLEPIFSYIKSKISEKKLFLADRHLELECKMIQEEIMNFDLPKAMLDFIYEEFSNLNANYVVVRSSGSLEDLKGFSFAGLYDSYLCVTKDQLISKIKKCIASVFNYRNMEYLLKFNINLRTSLNYSVIIQKLINPDFSGVMFTRNPLKTDVNEMYIESIKGMCEGLVKGKYIPNQYYLDRHQQKIKEVCLEEQTYKLIPNENGLIEVLVGDDDILSETMLNKLAKIGLYIESIFDDPQDIEWGVYNDHIYIFQTRPLKM